MNLNYSHRAKERDRELQNKTHAKFDRQSQKKRRRERGDAESELNKN